MGRLMKMRLKTTRIYHAGLPVNDMDRAERFYTEVLGFELVQHQGGPDGSDPHGISVLGRNPRITVLRAGGNDLVLFERPQPVERDVIREDGIAHQAFDVEKADFEAFVEELQREGVEFHGPIVRGGGRSSAVYIFDTEGNYLELHMVGAYEGSVPAQYDQPVAGGDRSGR
jgi:catechol-2,3-dioxygenase